MRWADTIFAEAARGANGVDLDEEGGPRRRRSLRASDGSFGRWPRTGLPAGALIGRYALEEWARRCRRNWDIASGVTRYRNPSSGPGRPRHSGSRNPARRPTRWRQMSPGETFRGAGAGPCGDHQHEGAPAGHARRPTASCTRPRQAWRSVVAATKGRSSARSAVCNLLGAGVWPSSAGRCRKRGRDQQLVGRAFRRAATHKHRSV